MFDYEPECYQEAYDEILKIEDEKIRDCALNAILTIKFYDIASEYNERHGTDEIVEKNNIFVRKHFSISSDIMKIVWTVDDRKVGYILDIVYDIVETIEKENAEKMRNYTSDNANFISFIKEEIPEIYEQLKKSYKNKIGGSGNEWL